MAGEDKTEERQDWAAWKKYRTGARSDYDSIRRDIRGYPLFVRATGFSKDWDQYRDAATDREKKSLSTEKNDGQYKDDIFLATPSDGDPVTECTSMASTLLAQDPDRGKAVASFYSQLPRDALVEAQEVRHMLESPENRQLLPRKIRALNKSDADWFIRKASAQMPDLEDAMSRAKKRKISHLTEGACSVCLAPLPISLSAGQWDAHRSSIAHQLAADGPSNAGPLAASSGTVRRKIEVADDDDQGGMILLKPSNLGYTALEKMGWQKGMGLGREEWEYGERLKQKTRGNLMRGKQDVIVISDSEEEEVDDLHLEIGSEQWLKRVQEELARSAASKPVMSHIEETEEVQTEELEDSSVRSRPLLEPIAVHLRPDRRGIGKALPASSRIVDGKKQGRTGRRGEAAQPEKRWTKAQRRQLQRQKQEEWKQLRSSLN